MNDCSLFAQQRLDNKQDDAVKLTQFINFIESSRPSFDNCHNYNFSVTCYEMISPVTLRDIASAAGVTKATASRTLRGTPDSSEAMRKKIQALAKKMGYRPDPALHFLSALRWKKKRAALGVSVAFLHLSKSYWGNWLKITLPDLREQAELLGYHLNEIYLDEIPLDHTLRDILDARGITALILGPDTASSPLAQIPWQDFAVATFDLGCNIPPVPKVGIDNYNHLALAVQKTIEHGYRRICIATAVASPDVLKAARCPQYAILLAQPVFRRHIKSIFLFDGTGLHPQQQKKFLDWIRSHKPDALISFSFTIPWCKEAGLNIPQKIAFIAINKSDAGIAGIYQPHFLLVQQIFWQLGQQIQNHRSSGKMPDTITLLRGLWAGGASLPPKNTGIFSPVSKTQF